MELTLQNIGVIIPPEHDLLSFVNSRNESQLVEIWEKLIVHMGISQNTFCKKYGINQGNFSSWRVGVKEGSYKRRSNISVRAVKSFISGMDLIDEKIIFVSPVTIVDNYLATRQDIVLIDGDNMKGKVTEIVKNYNANFFVFLRKDNRLRCLIGLPDIQVVHSLTYKKQSADHMMTIVASLLIDKVKNIYMISDDKFVISVACFLNIIPVCGSSDVELPKIDDQLNSVIKELNSIKPNELSMTVYNGCLTINCPDREFNIEILMYNRRDTVSHIKTSLVSRLTFRTKIIDGRIHKDTEILYGYQFQ